jgi:hypothetical protein
MAAGGDALIRRMRDGIQRSGSERAIEGSSVDVAGAAPDGKTERCFSDGKVMGFGLNGAAGGVLGNGD